MESIFLQEVIEEGLWNTFFIGQIAEQKLLLADKQRS